MLWNAKWSKYPRRNSSKRVAPVELLERAEEQRSPSRTAGAWRRRPDPGPRDRCEGSRRDPRDARSRRRGPARPSIASISAQLGPVDVLVDASLDVRREALVQPEIAPGGVGHEVAGPGMRELVGDERNEAPVPGEHRRGREGQPRVLHAAERKARRQHEDVVAIPAVGPVEPLGRLHHLLGVGELMGASREERTAPHTRRSAGRAPRTRGRRPRSRCRYAGIRCGIENRYVPSRCEVGLPAALITATSSGRRPHGRGVGDPDLRGVLDRYPAARVDRLGLGEEKRMPLAGRLRRREPLEARSLRAGRIAGLSPGRHRRARRSREGPRGWRRAGPTSKRAAAKRSPCAASAATMSSPRVSRTRLDAPGSTRSKVSVAVPSRMRRSNRTSRSRSTCRTRICPGSEYEWTSRAAAMAR